MNAGFLLVLGAALGLVGMLLSAGRAVAQEHLFSAAPAPVGHLIAWAPSALLGLGLVLALGSGIVLSLGWYQRRD